MSKAFTKEEPDEAVLLPSASARLPADTPNYITAHGHAVLVERLAAARAGNDPRAAQLAQRLETTRVVEPRAQPADAVVRFGDRVAIRCRGVDYEYRIVGIDETDIAWDAPPLSWLTPLARALIGAEVGDDLLVGDEDVEVVAISVCAPDREFP